MPDVMSSLESLRAKLSGQSEDVFGRSAETPMSRALKEQSKALVECARSMESCARAMTREEESAGEEWEVSVSAHKPGEQYKATFKRIR